MKKLFYFLELPTNEPGCMQKILLFQSEEEKRAVIGCPDKASYHSFGANKVEKVMKDKGVIPQEPKDEESFDRIWEALSNGADMINFQLMQKFFITNCLVEQN
jgi:hypothetical protein